MLCHVNKERSHFYTEFVKHIYYQLIDNKPKYQLKGHVSQVQYRLSAVTYCSILIREFLKFLDITIANPLCSRKHLM